MKKLLSLVFFLFLQILLFSQTFDTLTLEYCYQQAEKNYPLGLQKDLLDRSSQLRVSNLNKNYLPQLNLGANASLQSDVTEFSITPPPPLPAIEGPDISKDWYKITLDVNQVIYDGNITSWQKKLENATLKADQKSVEAEMYRLKERVDQLFFSIFFNQQNAELLLTTKKQLESKLLEVKSGVANGTMMATALDALQVELIRINQQLSENAILRKSAFKMLSELISVNIPESARLILPDVRISSMQFENKRPEYQLFDLQQQRVGTLKSMVITKWNPKIFAYGQAGYGRPGLNMLNDDFSPWWIVGAKLTWNFWNWNQNRNERQILDIQSDIIRTQKETFDKNLRISAEKDISEILRLSEVVQQDEEIIALREKITKTSSSQLDNGIITSSEYISRLNEEVMAKIAWELHRIQLVKAKQSYLFTLGKL